MSAETGLGASGWAFGSHTCKGTAPAFDPNPRTASTNAVLTHLGASAILFALVLLSAHAGDQTFAAIRVHAHHLPTAVRNTAFVLAVLGFGSKAGAVPLHVW